MKTMRQRLISLNLALLLLLGLGLSVSAETVEAGEVIYPAAVQAELPTAMPSEEFDDISLLDEAFDISVNGGTLFKSDTDQSGSGWTYTAKSKSLELRDYNGGPIIANGSLTIRCYGTTTIRGTAQTSSKVAVPPIFLLGTLRLYVYGKTTITGGKGIGMNASGIAANGVNIYCYGDNSISITGGAGAVSDDFAGHGIYGPYVYLSGGNISITGGKNTNGMGGCGILTEDLDVWANCTIRGGSGTLDGYGAYVYNSMELSYYFINIYGNPPVGYSDGGSITCRQHAVVKSATNTELLIEPATYTLRLLGRPGKLPNGATFTNLVGYYPTYYRLSDYNFTLKDHVLTGWQYGDTRYSPNASICPAGNGYATAIWLPVQKGDIVLQGLNASFSDGTYVQKSENKPVTLPDDLTYSYNTSVLGWTEEMSTTFDSQHHFSGTWFANGSTLQPDSSTYTMVYAQCAGTGQYARLHANGGQLTDGGNMLVYGTTASPANLEVYLPGDEQFVEQDGLTFRGWAKEPDGDVVYEAGDVLNLPRRTIMDLYAVWQAANYTVQLENGLTMTVDAKAKTVTLSGRTSAHSCLFAIYTDGGRMDLVQQGFTSSRKLNMEIKLQDYVPRGTVTGIQIFLLDTTFKPTADAAECSPAFLNF